MVVLEQLKSLGFDPFYILDVGSNRCDWSKRCRSVFPHSCFVLIEPQESMMKSNLEFCRQGDFFFPCAVGMYRGDRTITYWDDTYGTSLLPKEGYCFEDGTLAKQGTVWVDTVDNLLTKNNLPMPEMAKLDIQGAELDTLLGAGLLFKFCEAIILEVSLFSFLEGQPDFVEVVKFMDERGFVPYDIFNKVHRPQDRALGQCDICFVKRNGMFRKSNRWT